MTLLRSPSVALLFLPLVASCSAEPREPTLGQPLDGSAVWPLPTNEEGADVLGTQEDNPWLTGWGGEGSGTSPDGVNEEDDPGQVDEVPTDEGGADVDEGDPSEPEGEPELAARWFLEYWEGAASEKMLFIGGETGPSPGCTVEIYSNGGTSPWRRIALPKELGDFGTLGFCHELSLDLLCTHEFSGSVFNGNDALVLRCGDEVMDSFGRIGENPGKAWSSEEMGLRSEGQRLVRCAGAIDREPEDAFDLAKQWRAWSSEGAGDCSPTNDSPTNENGGAGGAPIQ